MNTDLTINSEYKGAKGFAPIAGSPTVADVNSICDAVKFFPPISLDETNKLAQMMSRTDNKYYVTGANFRRFAKALQTQFAVMTIDGRTHFSYDSCYYDDDYACYLDQHQGRRQRFKVRTRKYVDAGDTFFEVKLKGLRGSTQKHRVACDYFVTPQLSIEHLNLLSDVHQRQYQKPISYAFRPSLIVGYRRCTLVALTGGERVTIDYALTFAHPNRRDTPVRIGNNFIIIETKSGNGKGISDQILKNLRIRPAKKCSKYCIGVSLTGGSKKSNNFLSTLKQVRKNIVKPDRSVTGGGEFDQQNTAWVR